MRNTEIKPTESYWAIVRLTDIKGAHTGKAFNKIELVEFKGILALDQWLADMSVEAGESMGAFTFEVLTLYTSWDQFRQDVENEKEFDEEIRRERNEEYNRPSNEELGIEDEEEFVEPFDNPDIDDYRSEFEDANEMELDNLTPEEQDSEDIDNDTEQLDKNVMQDSEDIDAEVDRI